jgi:2-iminobutanoate/2-iminopropanoate deaminase
MPGSAVSATISSLPHPLSLDERDEMIALGLIARNGDPLGPPSAMVARAARLEKHAMHAHAVLNEAYDYAKAASFTRGIRFELGDKNLLLISGTASVDAAGLTTHAGDFRAQLWRTYRNITALLASEGATWHDIVRTTCYLRDIEHDYKDFNEIRTAFFGWLGLDPLPASTGIQATLCREDLLVEIEAMAVTPRRPRS